MYSFIKAALLPCLALASLQFTQAQPQVKPPEQLLGVRPDPADARAPVPALAYRSSLNLYRAFTEPEVAPWRETNELVGQRGGWRAYAREAREADAAQAPPPSAPGAPQPGVAPKPAMSGHKMN